MLGRMVRVLFGFILACLAAAAATVAFADIQELKLLSADTAEELLSTTGQRVLFAAIQGAIFSAPIAFVGIAIGEWRRIRSWSYYTLLALVITLLGFMAWYTGEEAGEPTIVNNYALTAFLTTGFIGGLVYWLFSGRKAGPRQVRDTRFDFAKSAEGVKSTQGVKQKPDKTAKTDKKSDKKAEQGDKDSKASQDKSNPGVDSKEDKSDGKSKSAKKADADVSIKTAKAPETTSTTTTIKAPEPAKATKTPEPATAAKADETARAAKADETVKPKPELAAPKPSAATKVPPTVKKEVKSVEAVEKLAQKVEQQAKEPSKVELKPKVEDKAKVASLGAEAKAKAPGADIKGEAVTKGDAAPQKQQSSGQVPQTSVPKTSSERADTKSSSATSVPKTSSDPKKS